MAKQPASGDSALLGTLAMKQSDFLQVLGLCVRLAPLFALVRKVWFLQPLLSRNCTRTIRPFPQQAWFAQRGKPMILFKFICIQLRWFALSLKSHYFCVEQHTKHRNHTRTRKRLFTEWYEKYNMPAPAKGLSPWLLMIIKVNYLLV